MEKQKNKPLPIRVYKPPFAMQAILWLAIIFVLGHFNLMIQSGDLGLVILFLLPIYAVILWTLFISSTQKHLAIYEDGIEHRIGNNRIFSSWEDVGCLEGRPAYKPRVFGIYTRHLQKRQKGNILEKLLLERHQNFIPLSGVVRVPTRWAGFWTGTVVDAEKLNRTEFGQELYHYAPHLFEVQKIKAKNG